MCLFVGGRVGHEVPGHVRQASRSGEIVGGVENRTAIGRVLGYGAFVVVDGTVCCCRGFVLEVCHQHGGSLKVEHTIAACLYLL